jgi:hypothetical protein
LELRRTGSRSCILGAVGACLPLARGPTEISTSNLTGISAIKIKTYFANEKYRGGFWNHSDYAFVSIRQFSVEILKNRKR